MGTINLGLKVVADAKAAVAGLKPLSTALEDVTEDAKKTEQSLADLDKKHEIQLNDEAIANARREVSKLQKQIRDNLRLGIDADDREAKKRIRSLNSSIKELEKQNKSIKLDVDTVPATRRLSGFRRSVKGIGTEMASDLAGATGALGGVAAAAGPAGIAIAAVAGSAVLAGKAIWDLAQQASGLEQAVGASDSVFKSTSEAMQDFAEDASQSAGLSERAYLEMATVVGAQLKNLGFSVSESAGMTNELLERGADLAATFGGSTTQAVEAIGSALRGEMDPIERYGISLNQAAVNAKALELGLWDGKGALDQHAKAVSVNALIMEQSADAAGQFARESETLAGQQQKATAEWENFTTAMGQGVLPIVTDFLTVTNYLVKEVNDLTEAGSSFATAWDKVPGPLKTVGKIAVGIVSPMIGLVNLVGEASDAIGKMPPEIETATAAQRALTKENNDLAYAMGVAGKAAADQAGELQGLVVGSEEYDKAVGKTLESLRQMVPALSDFTDEQITGMAITEKQAEKFEELKTSISDIQGAISGSVNSFTDLNAIYEKVTESGKKAFDAKAFIKEQKKRNDAIKDWRNNLATLADRGVSQDVINNLTQMGVEGGSALVESLAKHTTDKELKKIGENWTFGQTLGQQIGQEVAVAMVDAMDGKLDGMLNGKKIQVPKVEVPKTHFQKLEEAFNSSIKKIKAGIKKGVPVGADIKKAQEKLRQLQREAEKHPKDKKIGADVKAAQEKLRRLKEQAEKPATKNITAKAHTATANAALNDAARDRTSEIDVWINWPKIPQGYADIMNGKYSTRANSSTPSVGGNSLVPQLFGNTAATTATVAGLRAMSMAAPTLVAAAPASGRTVVVQKQAPTELRPSQTPLRVYLDGQEIADALQVKANRMTTSSLARRRA